MLFTLSLTFLAALGKLMQAECFFSGLGVNPQNTALALILFFLAMPVFTFLLTPLMSLLSRRHEYEADRYASEHASAIDFVNAVG